LFAAIWKTAAEGDQFHFLCPARDGDLFRRYGIVFPFVYGPNEIMASIGRFAIASPTFIVGSYLQLLVTPTRRSRLRYDCALIDGNAGVRALFKTAPRSTRRSFTRETNSWRGGSTIAR